MIHLDDSIRYTNVISRRDRFHWQEMEGRLKAFVQELLDAGATLKGPLFYSINNVPMDEYVNTELFMPVHEYGNTLSLPSDMRIHSYYAIESMISCCLMHSFETATELGYRILLDYIEQNGLTQTTPIFHVLSGDRSLNYVYIKVGASLLGSDTIGEG